MTNRATDNIKSINASASKKSNLQQHQKYQIYIGEMTSCHQSGELLNQDEVT